VTHSEDLTGEQARWLRRIIEAKPKEGPMSVVPDDVHDALTEKGLVQWRHGLLEATTEGIRQWASRRTRIEE
jgi:hypothetical protein